MQARASAAPSRSGCRPSRAVHSQATAARATGEWMQAIAIERFGGTGGARPGRTCRNPGSRPDALVIRTRCRCAEVPGRHEDSGRGAGTGRSACFFPLVPGWDVAGVVERAGPAVRGFAPGDEVIAYCRKDFIQEGTYAELVAVRARQSAQKPRSLSFEEASGLPLVGLTAYQVIHDALELQPGGGDARRQGRRRRRVPGGAARPDRGGAGDRGGERREARASPGAGRLRSASTTGTPTRCAAVREAHAEGIDAVFDIVGGETLERSSEVLRRGGRVVSIVQPSDAEGFARQGMSASIRVGVLHRRGPAP